MNDEIRIMEAGKAIEEIVRKQAIENIKRRNKRDERLALLMMALMVPVTYLVFWLLG